MQKGAVKPVDNEDAKGKVVIGKEQKTKIYLVATAFLLVVAAVFVLTYSTNTGCGNILIASQKASCLSAEALSSGSVAYCSGIASASSKASCVSAVAEKASEISYCGSLNGTYYSSCATAVALKTSNSTDCSTISAATGRGDCYLSLAKAQNYTSESTCSGIPNSTQAEGCNYSYLYLSALRTGNSNYCGMMTGPQNSTYLSDLIGLSNSTTLTESGVLYYYYYNFTPADYCYLELAGQSHNRSVCGLMSGEPSDQCYADFSSTNVTNSTSENITAICDAYPAMKSLCLSSNALGEDIIRAISEKNVTYCNTISNVNYRYDCIATFATQLNDSSACNYIGNSTIRAYCLAELANYST